MLILNRIALLPLAEDSAVTLFQHLARSADPWSSSPNSLMGKEHVVNSIRKWVMLRLCRPVAPRMPGFQ